MDSPSCRHVAVFGSTGSIGRNALEVIRGTGGRFAVAALSAHANLELLVRQALEFRPRWIVATDAEAGRAFPWPAELRDRVRFGPDGLDRTAAEAEIDIVVAAIVGSAGLSSTLAAIDAGKRIALANKETLVVAGGLAIERARASGAEIVPVDSEHSAVFQAIRAGRRSEVARVLLTASGGPFRDWPRERIAQATPAEALAHPNWSMGRKITVDSATMMNKALEVIEARWLFDLPAERLEVVVHRQSIVHSMVEFVDGSIVAQLGPPDMRLPILYALAFPERLAGPTLRLDITKPFTLDFEPPDPDRFPALALGAEVARRGGTTGAVLNAANEVAVERFLEGTLPFGRIAAGCRAVLDRHDYESDPSLETLLRLDRWARKEMQQWNRS